MDLDYAIKMGLSGNAILFVGSGFSRDATNIKGEKLLSANELCELLWNKINENKPNSEKIESDYDLEYASETFLEEKDAEGLIKLLKELFTVTKVSNSHKILMKQNWMRIYTTNYDNTMEKASFETGKIRNPVTLNANIKYFQNKRDIIIHLNGYIENLNLNSFNNEFKLTSSSYLSEGFANSEWVSLFRNDLENAKAIFFIGYSTKYDFDIKRIIVNSDDISEKCFFINGKDIPIKDKNILKKYGTPIEMNINDFAQKINGISLTKIESNLFNIFNYKNFKHFNNINFQIKTVTGTDVSELLFYGKVIIDHIRNIDTTNNYIIHRNVVDEIFNDLNFNNINFAIIHSDLGNGKTCIVYELIAKLITKGQVFMFNRSFSDISLEIEEMEKLPGIKYVIFENYNLFLSEINKFKNFNLLNFRFILTARSLLHDISYHALIKLPFIETNNLRIYPVNVLNTDKELPLLVALFNKYQLWGSLAVKTDLEKANYIKTKFKLRFQNILAGLLDANQINDKLCKITDVIKNDETASTIILSSFISDILSLNLDLKNILYLTNQTNPAASIAKNLDIKELLNIKENSIKLNSSILANYIIRHNDFSEKLINILIIIIKNADKYNYNEKYSPLLKSIISFGNLRLLLVKSQFENITYLYEGIKSLKFYRENPFFWLQYAIVNLTLLNFDYSKIHFEASYAFAKVINNFDTFQIDTHYARFLLERQLSIGIPDQAFTVFKEAHTLLINKNKNKPENFHYPLRQTSLYYPYYQKFFNDFTCKEQIEFLKLCSEALKKIDIYIAKNDSINREKNERVISAQASLKKLPLNNL